MKIHEYGPPTKTDDPHKKNNKIIHRIIFPVDIPEVNWVIQLDCPENANTYIHRAGRTARYQKGGESLLVLLPSEEEGMIQQLEEKKIPINKIRQAPAKLRVPKTTACT